MSALKTVVEITRASIRVLRRHRQLVVFPLLCLMSIVTLLVVLWPLLGDPDDPGRLGIGVFAVYFAFELTAQFFGAALTCEALRALRGQTTSIGGGLGCAMTRVRSLAELSAVSCSVGAVAGMFSGRDGRLARLLGQTLGTGWLLVSYLALPVMIAERRGSYDSLVRSSRLLRQTWGETAIAEIGLRVIGAQFVLVVLLLAALLADLIDQPLALVIAICLLVAFGVVVGALQAIYRAALYIFAVEGVIPSEFDSPAMQEVWRVK